MTVKNNFYFFILCCFVSLMMEKGLAEDVNQYLPGQLDQTPLVKAENVKTIDRYIQKGNTAFNFRYFKDTFDYKDNRGVFKRTFEEGAKSMRAGFLQVGLDYFIYKGLVDFTLGGNLGVGHNRGRGSFEGGDSSETLFQLWSLPVDFILGLEIPLSSYAKIGVYAGPSAIGLLQTRSDRVRGESKKKRNQMSYGYMAGARFKLGLARIFSTTMFDLLADYGVSNFFVTLEMQMRNYTHFLDEDVSIEGSSIGIGLTFEYL